MSFELCTQKLCSREIICRTSAQHGIELDHVLPDYCPEMFRIIRCTAQPSVISSSINADRLSYEMCVSLRMIYCTRDNELRTFERKLNYSGGAALENTGKCPAARIIPTVDYINCRAVTGRRAEIHGSVTVSISVTAEVEKEAVCDARGGGLLLRRRELTAPSSGLYAEKRISVSEELDLGEAKPPAAEVLRVSAIPVSCDKKVISDKVAVKGELKISMLYTPCSQGGDIRPPETMQFSVPFSHIMDMEGLSEEHELTARVSVISCEAVPQTENGSGRIISFNAMLLICCRAVRYRTVSVATDEFSTECATVHTSEILKLPAVPAAVNCTVGVKCTAEHREGAISAVYDAWCDVVSCDTVRNDDGTISVSGKAVCCCMAAAAGGETVICSADAPFRVEAAASGCSSEAIADITAVPVSCSYELSSDDSVMIKAEIQISGEVADFERVEAMTSVSQSEEPDNASAVKNDTAVKLYFAEKGEDLWETAKRCRTSPDAIAAENGLDSLIMQSEGMIVIPIN